MAPQRTSSQPSKEMPEEPFLWPLATLAAVEEREVQTLNLSPAPLRWD